MDLHTNRLEIHTVGSEGAYNFSWRDREPVLEITQSEIMAHIIPENGGSPDPFYNGHTHPSSYSKMLMMGFEWYH